MPFLLWAPCVAHAAFRLAISAAAACSAISWHCLGGMASSKDAAAERGQKCKARMRITGKQSPDATEKRKTRRVINKQMQQCCEARRPRQIRVRLSQEEHDQLLTLQHDYLVLRQRMCLL